MRVSLQYEITEKLSEDFIHAHYGVPKKNVCIIKNQELDEGDADGLEEFQQLWNWIQTADFSDDAVYQQLTEQVDMQSFADYVSAEIYINNNDWGGNNMALWKSMEKTAGNGYADGRWRFIMYDTEFSTGLYGSCQANQNTFDLLMNQDCFLRDLFRSALQNEQFRQQFARTFMDIANTCFAVEKIDTLIEAFYADYHDTAIDTYNRFWPDWPGGAMAERTYSDEKNSIRNFYHSRYASVVSDTKQVLGLSGTLCTLTVENDTEQGTVRINTVIPESGTWKGQYFSDYPVMLHAEPADGKQLAYWETSDGRKLYGSSAELSLSGDMTVTAVYEQAEIRKGDVNADGVFNTADLILLQKWLLAVPDARLADWETADFNADGKLTIFDFCLMKRALLHQN